MDCRDKISWLFIITILSIYDLIYLIRSHPLYLTIYLPSGFDDSSSCMNNMYNPNAYMLFREGQCMAHRTMDPNEPRTSHKLMNCRNSPNGPECDMEFYNGHKCKTTGRSGGLQFTRTMNWREVFNSTLPYADACGPEPRPIGMNAGANFYRVAIVRNGMLMNNNDL